MIAIVCSLLFSREIYAWDGLAIVGDSISSGAASHPSLAYDPLILWKIMTGELDVSAKLSDIPRKQDFKITDTLESPRRLWPGPRENDGASGWVWLHAIQALSRTALDTEEYSYGYLAGRALGLSPKNIWLAGDNGTKTDHALLHAARVLAAGQGELPTRIIMFYTGNDLCAQSWDTMTEAANYGANLKDAMLYLARNGHSANGEQTKIYIPAFLPVTSLLIEPSISEKEIRFHGLTTTCADARKRMFAVPTSTSGKDPNAPADPRYPLFAQFMPPNPVLLCPTLFATTSEDAQRQSILANRIRAYRDAEQAAVTEFNSLMEKNKTAAKIAAVYVEGTGALRFMGEDVAGDCFHLSAAGHAKLATELLKQLQ